MLVRSFPSFFVDNFEVLCSVCVAFHPDKHLRVLVHALVLQNVASHSTVTVNQHPSMRVLRQHPCHYSIGAWKRIAVRHTKGSRREEQKQNAEDKVCFHSQN